MSGVWIQHLVFSNWPNTMRRWYGSCLRVPDLRPCWTAIFASASSGLRVAAVRDLLRRNIWLGWTLLAWPRYPDARTGRRIDALDDHRIGEIRSVLTGIAVNAMNNQLVHEPNVCTGWLCHVADVCSGTISYANEYRIKGYLWLRWN